MKDLIYEQQKQEPELATNLYIVWLPSTREQLCGFNASGLCLVRLRMLHYLRVGSCITFTQSHTHTMQQTRTHKAVTGRIEAKKLLSSRRQSEYSHMTYLYNLHTQHVIVETLWLQKKFTLPDIVRWQRAVTTERNKQINVNTII